jgi:hypothetical protein
MDNTGGAIIGISAIGIGALIAYGAYKDVPVFGPSGLLTSAISTGKLQATPAKTSAAAGTAAAAGATAPSVAQSIQGTNPLEKAVNVIVDPVGAAPTLWQIMAKALSGKG